MIIVADAIVYQFPAAAWLMLATPTILWLYWRLNQDREAVLTAFLGSNLPKQLTLARSSTHNLEKAGCLVLAWLFATMGLMQPEYQRVNRPQDSSQKAPEGNISADATTQRPPLDVIFLLDTSASMNVADTQTGQTRLEQAKDIIADTITRLVGDNIGLDVFTTEVKQVVPPTLDHLYLRMLLRDVQINETGTAGTDFRRVLASMRQTLWSKPSDKMIILVIVSDGGDTELESLLEDQRSAYIQTILSGFGDIDVNHRRVFTVGMGSTEGQSIPEMDQPTRSALMTTFLQRLATWGNGAYFQASQYEGLGLSEDLASEILEGSPKPTQVGQSRNASGKVITPAPPPSEELFYWPLLAAIALLMASLALPEVDKSIDIEGRKY